MTRLLTIIIIVIIFKLRFNESQTKWYGSKTILLLGIRVDNNFGGQDIRIEANAWDFSSRSTIE